MNNIFKVQSMEQLKACGKLKQVREIFKEQVAPLGLKGKTNSWANMLESIQYVQGLSSRLQILTGKLSPVTDPSPTPPQPDYPPYQSDYFLSQAAEYIYILTNTDGKARKDLLGVNLTHYSDKKVAKAWMSQIGKYIHPDNCSHPGAQAAFQQLSEMYEEMIR